MTPPNKCEAIRRAVINVDNLDDLDVLSSETTILHEQFDPLRWRWHIVVSHDVLPSLAPGQMPWQYESVAIFNRMIEQQIAKAISGELMAEADQTAAYGLSLAQFYQQKQAAQWAQTQPAYTSSGQQANANWQSSTSSGFGQTLGGLYFPSPNTTGSNTP